MPCVGLPNVLRLELVSGGELQATKLCEAVPTKRRAKGHIAISTGLAIVAVERQKVASPSMLVESSGNVLATT